MGVADASRSAGRIAGQHPIEDAIKMAKRACALTQASDPEYLATLARVYAEVGRRPETIVASRRAVDVARRSGREDFARRVERDFREYWQAR